jgi:hypothetical protein
MTDYDQSDAKFFAKYAKLVECASKPLEESCKECLTTISGYKLFFFYQTSRLEEYSYKVMIHYNDESKKVLVSLAGPDAKEHAKYIQEIYTSGLTWVKSYKIQVEKEYKLVYFSKLRKVLQSKIEKIAHSGRGEYEYVFTGHSVGGSLAILASYDLTKSDILSKEKNGTKVYTFGALRIGDAQFVTYVNSAVRLFRIVKSDDYITRIPNCYYSLEALGWRCFTKDIISRFVTRVSSPLFIYLQNYRYSSFYTIPVVQAVRTYTVSYYRTGVS